MTNILIVHGICGSSSGNWFSWLKDELEKLGHNVYVPQFPTPEGQNLESWLGTFEEYKNLLDENSIVIGHSLGSAFLLSAIEKLNKPIKVGFFVATFLDLFGDEFFCNLNYTFIKKTFDFDKIKDNCKHFYVINSIDDPYIPLEKGKEFANYINAEFLTLENAGHINAEFGFTQFDFLLNILKPFLNE